jgi:hypothetical protein
MADESKNTKAAGVTITRCTGGASCKSEFQDKMYGPGQRVHNNRPKGGKCCTVCGAKT